MGVDNPVGGQVEHDRAVVAQGDRRTEARPNRRKQAHGPTGGDDDARAGRSRARQCRGISRGDLMVYAHQCSVEVDQDEAWRRFNEIVRVDGLCDRDPDGRRILETDVLRRGQASPS
jgi:hypothetical protein